MSTTAQTFKADGTGHADWDGTDPASGDFRKLLDTTPSASDVTSVCDFGTSGAKTITVKPYATSTDTGNRTLFGWAINLTGADGMGSVATAKRIIPAGTWSFFTRLAALPVASIANATLLVDVYRVTAAGARTLLFSGSSGGSVITAAGTNVSFSLPGQPQVTLEAGETIVVSYAITCTGQVGGLTISMSCGSGANDTRVVVPTPGIRTNYPLSIQVTGVGTASRSPAAIAHSAVVSAVGTVAANRQTVAARSITVNAVGTVARGTNVGKSPIEVTGVGTVSGRAEVPLPRIPDTGTGATVIVQPTAALAGVVTTNDLAGVLGTARVTGAVNPAAVTGGIRERAVTGDVTGDDIEGQVDC